MILLSRQTKFSGLAKRCRKFLTSEASATATTAELAPQGTKTTGNETNKLMQCNVVFIRKHYIFMLHGLIFYLDGDDK